MPASDPSARTKFGAGELKNRTELTPRNFFDRSMLAAAMSDASASSSVDTD